MNAIHEFLAQRIEAAADHPAISTAKGDPVSYTQLSRLIGGAQARLNADAIKVAGILSTRRQEAYVAVLACFFSGIRFVPMNPDLPADRLAKIALAGGVEVILGDGSTAKLAAELPSDFIDMAALPLEAGLSCQPPDPQATAYQMFTSGSTGAPKGVPISYASLAHYTHNIIDTLQIPQGGRFSQLFDLSFDLSMHDIFVCIASGGTLCPASKMDLMMPHLYLDKRQIDVWFSVPMLAAMAVNGQISKPVSHKMEMALFCGEPLPTQHAAGFTEFLREDAPLYNLYGPTEATIAFTAERFEAHSAHFSSVPLGLPFGENLIAVETADGVVTTPSDGLEGELLLGGPQVFDGYSPHVGADCFVMAEGIRFYRSGDLVRMDQGALLHLGRTDNQIKFRGYRIELGDIEAAARKAFGCAHAAAVVLGDGEHREIGLAYEAADAVQNVATLKEALPAYMMPTRFLRVEQMPVNINGKIDRKALRQMVWPA